MINGAKEIFSGISARHLDPMFLAKSQTGEANGLIMISYEQHTDDDHPSPKQRFYDLLFLKGPAVCDCARLNQDLRFKLNIETLLQTFTRRRNEPGTVVSLFKAPDEIIHLFQLTFYYEPCLSVQIEALSKEQMSLLLNSHNCRRGIIEYNEFIHEKPSIELIEFSERLGNFQPAFDHGRLLLYDIYRNKEILRELYTDLCLTGDSEQCRTLSQLLTRPLMTPQLQNPVRLYAQDSGVVTHPPSEPCAGDRPADSTPETVSSDSHQPDDHPAAGEAAQVENECLKEPEASSQNDVSGPGNEPQSAPPDAADTQTEFVKLFSELYFSFSELAAECFDGKLKIIAEAEDKVRARCPEFDPGSLTPGSALLVLDVVESVVESAIFYKRSKIREGALALISALYKKHYDLLEKHDAVHDVEQTYFQLKK